MTKDQLRAQIASATAQHVQAGRPVLTYPCGQKSEAGRTMDSLRHCQCGCAGDYTDHTMRLGESGR